MSEQPKYYIKHLDRTKGAMGAYGAPNWCIYERLEHGSNAVCLCYTEEVAQLIMGLLDASCADMTPQGLDDPYGTP